MTKKKMIYHIGDRFVINGISCKVAYLNRDMAWVVPEVEIFTSKGTVYRTGCTFAILMPNGKTKDGDEIIPVSPSGAV